MKKKKEIDKDTRYKFIYRVQIEERGIKGLQTDEYEHFINLYKCFPGRKYLIQCNTFCHSCNIITYSAISEECKVQSFMY